MNEYAQYTQHTQESDKIKEIQQIKETQQIKDTNSQEEEKGQKYKMKMYNVTITVSCLIALMVFNLFLHSYVIDKRFYTITLICTFFIPFMLICFSYLHHKEMNRLNIKKEYELLKEENEHEQHIVETLPLILFGLGIIYTQYRGADYMSSTIVYLLLSVIFGYILPQLSQHMVFDNSKLLKLFILDELNFAFISVTIGLLLTAMLIPIYMRIHNLKN